MKRQILTISIIPLLATAGFIGRATAQTKPFAAIRADLASFRLDGSNAEKTANKRLTFVILQYNEARLPCVVVDAAGSFSNNMPGSASISCGWSPQTIEALTNAPTVK